MSSDVRLQRYAQLLARRAMNVQPQQQVNISCLLEHKELALLVGQEAYAAGAKHVSYEFICPEAEVQHLLNAPQEGLEFVPRHFGDRLNELVDNEGCQLRITSMDDAALFSKVDPAKINLVAGRKRQSRKLFYDQGINAAKVQWVVAAAPTVAWSRALFPTLSEEEGVAKLWDQIYKLVRADRADFLQAWDEHDKVLHDRSAKLNQLGVRRLHFKGPDTDLWVGLSDRAVFGGGSKLSSRGAPFIANIPTEEIFTTPDWRETEGQAAVTRPVTVNGTSVEGLVMQFKGGMLQSFTASKGVDAFQALIDTDPGARRLGEVALVGVDSPVYQSGLVFREILFDENACCHIAVGNAYKGKLKDYKSLSAAEFDALGCNESGVHVDFMISSDRVDVDAVCGDGSVQPLLKNGAWLI